MTFSFYLDALIAVLLVATIAWCVLLNRRLVGLRRHQSELAGLIAELNMATERAEAGIAELKHSAEATGATLQSSIARAQRLNDDLTYLSERGSRLVDRLDHSTRSTRRSGVHASSAERGAVEQHKKTQQALLDALRAARESSL